MLIDGDLKNLIRHFSQLMDVKIGNPFQEPFFSFLLYGKLDTTRAFEQKIVMCVERGRCLHGNLQDAWEVAFHPGQKWPDFEGVL